MVPPQGRGSDRRSRTHSKDALSGGSGGNRSQHSGCSGGGSRRKNDGGSISSKSNDVRSRARVGAAGRGRRRLSHSGWNVVSSVRLHHGWVGEVEEMERMAGGEVLEVVWNENERGWFK